jgi:hypothetical protein
MELPKWSFRSQTTSAEHIVTVHVDTVGGGARIEVKESDGKTDVRWYLPNGAEAISEAEYIERMQRVRP